MTTDRTFQRCDVRTYVIEAEVESRRTYMIKTEMRMTPNWRATITWNTQGGQFTREIHEHPGEAHQVVLEAARAGKIPADRPYKIEVEEMKS